MLPTFLKGARTHNLKQVDLEIRPRELVAITGVSGSGKSSLAMDTLYAEGQRRFVESFSPYARQFLERLERPPMESLEPVAAGIAVDRRAPIKSSRSTVATMADIEPYLAALFTREAKPLCPEHKKTGVALDAASATERVLRSFDGEFAVVTYPQPLEGREQYLELREQWLKSGYRRLWLGGRTRDLDAIKPSEVFAGDPQAHVVVDRLKPSSDGRERLHAAIEQAFDQKSGIAEVHTESRSLSVHEGLCCPECGRELPAPRAGLFSYESPLGACPQCRGFGRVLGIDFDKVVDDPQRSLKDGAIRPWRGRSTQWERRELRKLCERQKIPMTVPWSKLSQKHKRLVLQGDGSWERGLFPGVRGWFSWLETRTYKMHVRVLLSRYRSYDPCPACDGKRLNPLALGFVVGELNLSDWHALEIHHARGRIEALHTRTAQGELARRELLSRLSYLERVGLGYLTLERQARTLSGGEAQRVTLTAALGTSMHHALFVLDEPTVGLHPLDVQPISELLQELSERNNAVLVIEHDARVIRAADRVVELGPGAGPAGGRVTFDGSPAAAQRTRGPTGRSLKPGAFALAGSPRSARQKLLIKNAREHNLANVDVELPLGVLCAITGPSGSGKSTLAEEILFRALARRLGQSDIERPGAHDRIEGAAQIRSVQLVDQSPLGRTSRGNAATYTKAWDIIRRLLAATPEAKARAFDASHFSFNVDKGRCEACAGEGFETVEMQFLADVKLVCPVCKGRRFVDDVLSVRLRGWTVAQLLEASVDEVLDRLGDAAGVLKALKPVADLGLGYLRLGQPLSTLSGGEAQRLKLARALKQNHKQALLILDEPSAGLHADEVDRLLNALDKIVRLSGSVLVVEHDLDIIARADWIIEMGPAGGRDGGRIMATGTPAQIARTDTATGRALREHDQPLPPEKPVQGGKRTDADELTVTRACEHNLKELTVSIPHQRLTVVTGPSGSGKSSLAFDVIFAEGQRRFLETLTPYARQFLPTMPRPNVDSVVGVPPSIALEQRTTRAGGRSTVATVTEVAHYLRLAYAKLGVLCCPDHDVPIENVTPEQLLATVRGVRKKSALLAPAVRARKGIYLDLFAAAERGGITRAYCDGQLVDTDDPPRLARQREHDIDLVITELKDPAGLTRQDLDSALSWGQGSVKLRSSSGKQRLFSSLGACEVCGFSHPELDPRYFSFNTKQGRCARCDGYGVVEDARASRTRRRGRKRSRETAQPAALRPCPACDGTRLRPLPRKAKLKGLAFSDLCRLSVERAFRLVKRWSFPRPLRPIASPIVSELLRRLGFLCEVGLQYLNLDRAASTLSGGELQRLRLAAQLGSGLTGALYVLDEPTIGLHPRDTGRLLFNLRRLVDTGSTIVVVEHDADTIRNADHLIDLGPGGGRHGGRLVAEGAPQQVLRDTKSPTARALSAPVKPRPSLPVAAKTPRLLLVGARQNNLRDVTLKLPLARFNVVAGVSGSGKSTLVRQVLLPALREKLGLVADAAGPHDALSGTEPLKRAVSVDQSPIGRTPRSVPATFLGIWDVIRRLFAETPAAKMRGYSAARFSFNTAHGGRCPECTGQGYITHEMSFLPDVVAPCPTCKASRFEPLTLAVTFKGLSIADVLALSAEEAVSVFASHPAIARPLKTLCDLGAGYIALGQGSHTLSGGEAQRLKLSAELTASSRHEATLYVLDEPTTGLHLSDVEKLMSVLSRLVERGDTLLVIEHHPLVIAGADHVVELGPEGGERGGKIIFQGPPSQLAHRNTPTGKVVRQLQNPALAQAEPDLAAFYGA